MAVYRHSVHPLQCCSPRRTSLRTSRITFLYFSSNGLRYASGESEHMKEPPPWPSTTSFTPYDIFQQDRNAPYIKTRFYELAKIYHPDRPSDWHRLSRNLSPEVRIHRYRLIVTAHEILSDPVKRAEYDRSGSRWHSKPSFREQRPPHCTNWNDPIFRNGTWEDWERWNSRDNATQVQPVSHRTFVSLIVLLGLFGGLAQASWLTQFQSGYEQRIQELNAQSARFLANRRQQSTDQMRSSEARVQSFLIRRDPSGYGLKEEEEDVYQQMLDPRQPKPVELNEQDSSCPNIGRRPGKQ